MERTYVDLVRFGLLVGLACVSGCDRPASDPGPAALDIGPAPPRRMPADPALNGVVRDTGTDSIIPPGR